jgi:hypothetical protein
MYIFKLLFHLKLNQKKNEEEEKEEALKFSISLTHFDYNFHINCSKNIFVCPL